MNVFPQRSLSGVSLVAGQGGHHLLQLVVTSFFWVLSFAEHCWLTLGEVLPYEHALAAAAVAEEYHVAISLGFCECLFLLRFLVVVELEPDLLSLS